MRSIFTQTITNALRQRHLQVMSVILILLFSIVAFNSMIAYKARIQSFERAKDAVRKAWLNQGPQNPHNSAHYGHYIFQPVDAMQFLDNGTKPFTGTVLRLEAHAQNEAAFSPAQDKTELSRFGDMSFAWMLQVLMPLFIILFCFNAVSADWENQNLKLLSAQGIRNSSYLWGKILSLYAVVVSLSLVGLLIQLFSYQLFSSGTHPILFLRIAFWFAVNAAYLFVLTCLSVLVSAWVKKSSTSLVMQLACWILLMIVMPKITAGVGAALYPMEHKAVFTKALKEDREKGIDGHNPADQRSKKFMDSVVSHYNIDSNNVKDIYASLPVNLSGLIMQADEEYSNLVYDKHFKRVRENIMKQNSISKYASFVNPYLAIRNTSMGISQSDFSSHLNLLISAELYRRYLIKELNNKMAYGGSKTGDWDWKVDANYWGTIKDFTYPNAKLSQSVKSINVELAAILFWILLVTVSTTITSKKLTVL
jgi:ABC-2 type transport system permease protein